MRFQIGGYGDPIPTIALPDDGGGSVLPPLAVYLENGVPFLKAVYLDQGYTNFDVWCVGACGGSGGGITKSAGSSGGTRKSWGGSGGGGGLHHVAGLLSDLPASCPVVIGAHGSDGQDGNGASPYLWVTDSTDWHPNPAYVPPLNGNDGGATTFNGATCRASGGKGGKATPADPGTDRGFSYPGPGHEGWTINGPGGDGGAGGLGDTAVAGGGGAGGTAAPIFGPPAGPSNWTLSPPLDGAWDGTVGSGGGGGRGGNYQSSQVPTQEFTYREADAGAQGSWSFSDTTVFGPHQDRSSIVGILGAAKFVIPGGGGGAKLNKLSLFGSRAPSSSLDGAIFIRLTAIV